MSDVFISYAREDQAQSGRIAEQLRQRGWTVWWDKKIAPGKSFDSVIESELSQARCIVVLWSRYSVNSAWVKNEAEEGNQRNLLVPVLLEDVKIPIGFRHIQAANLVGWSGDPSCPEFGQLIESLSSLLAQSPGSRFPIQDRSISPFATPPTPIPPADSKAKVPRIWQVLAAVVAAVVVIAAAWLLKGRNAGVDSLQTKAASSSAADTALAGRALETLREYYRGLNSGDFRAARYFSSRVALFITMKKTDPDAIDKYINGRFREDFKEYHAEMDEQSVRMDSPGVYFYTQSASYSRNGQGEQPSVRIRVTFDQSGRITSFSEATNLDKGPQ